jgi:hypothetical protein
MPEVCERIIIIIIIIIIIYLFIYLFIYLTAITQKKKYK